MFAGRAGDELATGTGRSAPDTSGVELGKVGSGKGPGITPPRAEDELASGTNELPSAGGWGGDETGEAGGGGGGVVESGGVVEGGSGEANVGEGTGFGFVFDSGGVIAVPGEEYNGTGIAFAPGGGVEDTGAGNEGIPKSGAARAGVGFESRGWIVVGGTFCEGDNCG